MLKPKTSVQNTRALHYKRFTQIEKSDALSTVYKTIDDDKFWKFDFNKQKFIEVESTMVTKYTKIVLITEVSVIKHKDAYFKYLMGSWEMVGGTSYYSSYNEWTPGLYDDDNNLVKTWEQLVEEKYFKIERSASHTIINKGSNPDFDNLTGRIVFTHEADIIEYGVFDYHEKPISIVLPDNIKQLARCFYKCLGLRELIVGKNVYNTSLSFEFCDNLELLYTNSNGIDSSGWRGEFLGAGINTNGMKIIVGSNVKLFGLSFGYNNAYPHISKVISVVFEENSKLEKFYTSFEYCTDLKYVFLPNIDYSLEIWQFAGLFWGCSPNLTLYCEFSEEQLNHYIKTDNIVADWNHVDNENKAKVVFDYKPVYTLDNIYNGNIAKYQINKYFFVDSFDYMIKGSIDKYESQPLRGLITPSQSFQIRTFDDNIDLDHDDLVVIDGKLYAVEDVELVQKRVPKKFNIYFATLRSIL